MKILVTYDGTLHSKSALRYGIEKVKEQGGEVTALYVFNPGMFVDYDAHPDVERMARREALGHVEAAKTLVKEADAGVKADVLFEEGAPEEEIVRYAKELRADVILATPRYKSIMRNAPCPVSIIPGHILVPVDNTDSLLAMLGRVVKEAKAAESKVMLLGIVPVHIYGPGEKDELEKVRKETSLMLGKVKKQLKEEGIDTKELISAGYPDEEILKAAEAESVSMIMIPDSGDAPSELNKAAH
ncbi:MAG TPA: universal stress protein, partial [Dissulfurispiraceae bacterium]